MNTKNQFIAFYLIGSFIASHAQEGYSFFGLSNIFYERQKNLFAAEQCQI